MHKATLSRAIKRAQKNLPSSPRKRSKVVQKLALKFSPETFLPPSKRREASGLSSDVLTDVRNFYEQDDISSQAPGKKDFVILRENGEKKKIQKRFLTMTLGESYEQFKLAFPDKKLGKSKFADLRPKHVCLRSDTPANICLCIYHENVRLILESLPGMTSSTADFVKRIVCSDEDEKCMFQNGCSSCGDLKKYDDLVDSLFGDMADTEIRFKQWVRPEDDQLIRQSQCDSVQNVLATLRSKISHFLFHVFIKRVQSTHFNTLKQDLPLGTILIQTDFSENFLHKVQDEIQSVYWDTKSSTLYTAMVYYSKQNGESVTMHSEPYVIISNYKNHDKYAVVVFNDILLDHFKCMHYENCVVSNIEYQSDGTAQHFKQKFTLCSLTLQSIPAKWNFSATSHGKGCIDGIGGTVKRRVSEKVRAQCLDISSSNEFAKLATEICPNINVLCIEEEQVDIQKPRLDAIWNPNGQEIKTLPGTRTAHYFEAVEPYVIRYASHSAVDVSEMATFSFKTGNRDQTTPLNSESITSPQTATIPPRHVEYACGQWVNVEYESAYYHGLILDVKEGQYQIRCLKLGASRKAFVFEPEEDTIWYTKEQIKSHMKTEPTLLNARGMYKI